MWDYLCTTGYITSRKKKEKIFNLINIQNNFKLSGGFKSDSMRIQIELYDLFNALYANKLGINL